jgi:hypothetical protein
MPKYKEPPAYRLVQRSDGSFNVLARDDRGVTHIRPLRIIQNRPLRAEPNPDPYHRVLHVLRWVSEVASVGLVEDQRLVAALGDFEHALIAYLDTRP